MKSIALNNERYWDARGLYDSSIHKTQQEINATIVNEEMLASVEYNTASGKAHEIGELIIFDGKVCRVTSHIDVGDNIIIGQNVRETTIANEFRTEFGFVTFSSVWTGNDPYTQTVHPISSHSITQNTKVDIQVNNSIANKLLSDSVRMLYIENNNGTLTAYAVGGKPKEVFSVQCTIYDVAGANSTVLGDAVLLSGNSDGSGSGGTVGDIMIRTETGATWATPANSPISGDMRPITSDAVYTAIGNINALLATI